MVLAMVVVVVEAVCTRCLRVGLSVLAVCFMMGLAGLACGSECLGGVLGGGLV